MILQALKEYYDRKAADPESGMAPEGWEPKEIPFLIVLDANGNFLQIEDIREGDGKKKRGKTFLVPQAVKKTSGVSANLLGLPAIVWVKRGRGRVRRSGTLSHFGSARHS